MATGLENRLGLTNTAFSIIVKRRDYLLENHPEIVDKYRACFSTTELALEYLPDDYSKSENVAKNSILAVLYVVLGEEEKKKLGLEHKRKACTKRKDYTPKQQNQKRINGGKRGYEKGKLKGLSSIELSKNIAEMMKRKGMNLFEGERKALGIDGIYQDVNEKEYIMILRDQFNLTWYQIADLANLNFSHVRPRTYNTIRVKYQDWKNEKVEFSKENRVTLYGEIDEKSYMIMLREHLGLSWNDDVHEVNSIWDNSRTVVFVRSKYNREWKNEGIIK